MIRYIFSFAISWILSTNAALCIIAPNKVQYATASDSSAKYTCFNMRDLTYIVEMSSHEEKGYWFNYAPSYGDEAFVVDGLNDERESNVTIRKNPIQNKRILSALVRKLDDSLKTAIESYDVNCRIQRETGKIVRLIITPKYKHFNPVICYEKDELCHILAELNESDLYSGVKDSTSHLFQAEYLNDNFEIDNSPVEVQEDIVIYSKDTYSPFLEQRFSYTIRSDSYIEPDISNEFCFYDDKWRTIGVVSDYASVAAEKAALSNASVQELWEIMTREISPEVLSYILAFQTTFVIDKDGIVTSLTMRPDFYFFDLEKSLDSLEANSHLRIKQTRYGRSAFWDSAYLKAYNSLYFGNKRKETFEYLDSYPKSDMLRNIVDTINSRHIFKPWNPENNGVKCLCFQSYIYPVSQNPDRDSLLLPAKEEVRTISVERASGHIVKIDSISDKHSHSIRYSIKAEPFDDTRNLTGNREVRAAKAINLVYAVRQSAKSLDLNLVLDELTKNLNKDDVDSIAGFNVEFACGKDLQIQMLNITVEYDNSQKPALPIVYNASECIRILEALDKKQLFAPWDNDTRTIRFSTQINKDREYNKNIMVDADRLLSTFHY